MAGERLNLTALTTDELQGVYCLALAESNDSALLAILAEAEDRKTVLDMPEDTGALPN